MIADVGKMALLGLVIIVLAVLRLNDAISAEWFGGTMLLVVGYLIGNGVNAVRGKAPSPVFAPKPDQLTDDALRRLAEYIAPLAANLARQATDDADAKAGT